jgi:hypothetical protein
MQLSNKKLDQLESELNSRDIDVVSINQLPIGETAIKFHNLGIVYLASFKDRNETLTSLMQLKRLTK